MKLTIDTRGKVFTVAREAEPRLNNFKTQREDKNTGDLLWLVQLFVRDEDGGSVINVSFASKEDPDLAPGEEVKLTGLYAYEWSAGTGRRGMNYAATSIEPIYEDEKV